MFHDFVEVFVELSGIDELLPFSSDLFVMFEVRLIVLEWEVLPARMAGWVSCRKFLEDTRTGNCAKYWPVHIYTVFQAHDRNKTTAQEGSELNINIHCDLKRQEIEAMQVHESYV